MKVITTWLMTTVTVFLMPVLTATAQKNQLGQKKVITLAVAKQIAAAAEKEICKPKCGGAIAIVDDGGNLIYEETLDHTQSPSIQLSIEKARTAALYRRPTQTFHDAVAKATNLSYQDGSFPNMTTAIGGAPLVVDGEVIGGIGLSGNAEIGVAPLDAALKEFAKITAH